MQSNLRQATQNQWFWLIPIILVMSLLVMLRIDSDGFWYDELYSVRNAGGALYGPLGLTGIIQRVIETDPYQALGYPLFLGGWGTLVGWTPFATRVLSWLMGIITVAVTYRMANAILRSRWGAILSTLILSLTAFFIHFNHELRTFTFVTCFATTLIWAYWHIITQKQRPSRWAIIGFVLSAVGLLYTHYYTALLLIGLGLYHLLVAPKNTRWVQIVGLAVLVGVLFIPQIPGFLYGFTLFQPENLGQIPLTAPEVLQTTLYYAGNGLIVPIMLILIAGMIIAWRDEQFDQMRPIILIVILTMIVVILANDVLEMLEPRRIRYIIFLTPPIALWIATGILAVTRWIALRVPSRPLLKWAIPLIFASLWVANGIIVNLSDTFTNSIEAEPIPRFRSLATSFDAHLGSNDVLALYNGEADEAFYMQEILALSLYEIPIPTLFTANLYIDSTQAGAQAKLDQADRIWYGINRYLLPDDIHTQFLGTLQEDYILCDTYVDRVDLTLSLWVRIPTFCPTDTTQITYGDLFTLQQVSHEQSENQLTVYMNWQLSPSVPPETYSIGTFLVDTQDTIIAQTDAGFPDANLVPYTTTFDLTNIPSGTYDVRVIVYQWRDGQRLTGRTASGSTGEFLTVTQVSIP